LRAKIAPELVLGTSGTPVHSQKQELQREDTLPRRKIKKRKHKEKEEKSR